MPVTIRDLIKALKNQGVCSTPYGDEHNVYQCVYCGRTWYSWQCEVHNQDCFIKLAKQWLKENPEPQPEPEDML
jgi:hypothetical protein